MIEKPLPIIKSILSCLEATKETDGSWTLRGVGNVIAAQRYPAVFPLKFYFQVTEVYGPQKLKIEVSDAATEFIGMWGESGILEASSPQDVISTTMTIPQFEIPKPGEYVVRVLRDDDCIADLRLWFRKL